MYEEAMKGVRHLLVRKSSPNGLVFVGELPYGPNGAFSPKMDHLVCVLEICFSPPWFADMNYQKLGISLLFRE